MVFPFMRISVQINNRVYRQTLYVYPIFYTFPHVNCMEIITFYIATILIVVYVIKSKMGFRSGTYEKIIGLMREESALFDASLPGYKDHILKKILGKH